MDFELNEEQRAFRDAAKAFAEGVFAPGRQNGTPGRSSCRRTASGGSARFAGIYCREAWRLGLKRQDATVISRLSAGCTSSAYISIHNMATG